MKKKGLIILGLTAAMSVSLPLISYAGQWQQNANGWWWQEDDGTYPVNKYKWIDGNNDGIAELYYFDENGYLLTNGKAPNNLTMNENGAWTSESPGYPPEYEVETQDASSFNYTQDSVQGLYRAVESTLNGEQQRILPMDSIIEIKADANGNLTEMHYSVYGLSWIEYFPQTGDREWTYTVYLPRGYMSYYTQTVKYYFPDANTLIKTSSNDLSTAPVITTYVKQ